jgi:hypothetical protein
MSSALTTPTTLPPPPRRVHRKFGTGCGINFLRLFILPHTLIGIALLAGVLVAAYISTAGQPVTATIDKTDTYTSAKRRTSYRVYYHFTLDGIRYDKRDTVPFDTYTRAHPGDSIAGRAGLVFNHAFFYGPGPYGEPNPFLLAAFALFWNGIVGIFFYIAWIAPIRQRLLVKYGSAAPGVITGKRIWRGKKTHYRLSYTFTPRSWDAQHGSCHVSRSMFDAAQPDDPCTILYDPNQPKRNLAYEFCDFTATSGF